MAAKNHPKTAPQLLNPQEQGNQGKQHLRKDSSLIFNRVIWRLPFFEIAVENSLLDTHSIWTFKWHKTTHSNFLMTFKLAQFPSHTTLDQTQTSNPTKIFSPFPKLPFPDLPSSASLCSLGRHTQLEPRTTAPKPPQPPAIYLTVTDS